MLDNKRKKTLILAVIVRLLPRNRVANWPLCRYARSSMQAGERVGPYEILSRIGEGGMGTVYKARDTRLDRTVAIKKSTEAFSERFEREA